MSEDLLPISITILTKNSERTLAKTLESTKGFHEVLVVDTGSTDATLEVAAQFPHVKIVTCAFDGFGTTHNRASNFARYDWIFSLDSDEVISEKLLREIQQIQLRDDTVYNMPRRNFYRNRWIYSCGWSPDRIVRIYNRKTTAFSNAYVHEKIFSDGLKIGHLRSPLYHYPYLSSADFLRKLNLYSALFGKENARKSSSVLKAFLRGFFAFFRCYILKGGIIQGGRGFEIAFYNAVSTFYKWLAVRDIHENSEHLL